MKKKKTSLCSKITIFCTLISVLCIAIWVILFKINFATLKNNKAAIGIQEEEYLNEPKKENLSVLFAGVDKDGLRTDTIIYAKYDTVNNILYMMSIPRDTYTTNSYANNKINSIYNGGKHTKEFIEEVESILDVKIDYYAVINLDLIPKVVDEIGGLKITLDKEVWKLNKKTNKWYFVFPKGAQTLSASQVETLVRNRDYPDGDLSREKMQRKVVGALIENMMNAKNILKVPSIINIVLDNTNTNITVREAMKYVSELKEIDTNNIISSSMPIENISYVVNGMDCVIINKSEAKRIIKEDWIYTPPEEVSIDTESEI